MKCPADDESLTTTTYETEIRVDECPSCRGIWLDQGELERIQKTRERDYSEELRKIPDSVAGAYEMARQKTQGERTCPACGREMEKREYAYSSRILIDSCPSCRGVWLDRGEVQALEVFFERARRDAQSADRGLVGAFFAGLLD
jgi:hypothetical protein